MRLNSSLEDILQNETEVSIEYLSTQGTRMLLENARWENIVKVIEKENAACKKAYYNRLGYFRGMTKMVDVGFYTNQNGGVLEVA